MPAYPVRALVLRKTKLGETDVIVTLLAADGSQIRAVAKGKRKPGSRFGGRLEPYVVADLLLHTGKSLDVITEADTIDSHGALREDYDRSMAAAVVADLLDKIAVEAQGEPRLFGLANATLSAMEVCPPAALPALVAAFLVKALAMHGYRPELDSCAACACEATGGRLFSMGAGGVLCPQCGERDGSAIHFHEEGRALLVHLLGSTMTDIAAEELPADTVAECLELMRSFVGFHIPARLKALDMYAGPVL
jgi:DNA repair protein RecO (recombination protein O)